MREYSNEKDRKEVREWSKQKWKKGVGEKNPMRK